MASTNKSTFFVFVTYPESAPKDWMEKLKASHGAFAVSPLHEPDEENAKPHYHVIYKHGGPITLDGAKRVIPAGIAANGYVEPCPHPRGYQRYLVHLDDPEKQQWEGDPRELIWTCGGFPLDLSRELTKAELQGIRADIMAAIRDANLTEYADLLDLLLDSGMWDHFEYAFNHTIAFNAYLASRRGRSATVLDRSSDE
jgi:hypothetical protein